MNLYIVSLKKFYIKNGKVHTYGGFGDYVRMFLDEFDEIHLCVPLCPSEIEGGYVFEHKKIHYHFLPYYKNELWLLLKSPLIFFKLLRCLPSADIVNPRIPDMTGVYGWLIGNILSKPMFVSIQSDITLLLENNESTRLKGVMRMGLFLWLRLYLVFERIIVKRTLSFPQGIRLVEKYCVRGNPAIPWVSTSISDDDIRLKEISSPLSDKKTIRLLNVARLTRQKNQMFLLSVVRELRQRGYDNVELTIIGKKDDRIYNELVEASMDYGISAYVKILPPVNHGSDLWRIYDSSDIFVLTSMWEGTPKVVLEALARSLPVVSTNVGGIPTVINHSYNGFLCDKDDQESFVGNIIRIINMDKSSLSSFVGNGVKTAHEYTLSKQREIMLDAIRREVM